MKSAIATETSETVGLKCWEDVYSVSGEGWAWVRGEGGPAGGGGNGEWRDVGKDRSQLGGD